MAQFRTFEALVEVGKLRQYLDAVKPRQLKETAEIRHDMQHLIDTHPPEDMSSTPPADSDDDMCVSAVYPKLPADERPTHPLLSLEEAADDAYATRRGANHWTRRRASQGPTRKITDAHAAAIRRAYSSGCRAVDLAADYDVSTGTINGIVSGRTHKRASAGYEAK